MRRTYHHEHEALVKDSLPKCKVFISTPTLRTDDGKAQITVSQLIKHLLQLKIDTVNNNTINVKHLGSKGLHLNQSGSKLLSKNFLNTTERFVKSKDVQIFRITDSLSLNIL